MRELRNRELAAVAGGVTFDFSLAGIQQWLKNATENNWTAALFDQVIRAVVARPIAQLLGALAGVLGMSGGKG